MPTMPTQPHAETPCSTMAKQKISTNKEDSSSLYVPVCHSVNTSGRSANGRIQQVPACQACLINAGVQGETCDQGSC